MKCKCVHTTSMHADGDAGSSCQFDYGDGFCECPKFKPAKPRPRRRAKPFERWSVIGTAAGIAFNGRHVAMESVVESLNAAGVVLKRGRS